MLLKDKVCVITGAASERGLGKAAARMMAEHGAFIVIMDLDAGAASAAAADITKSSFGIACDVTDPGACRQAAEDILERAGSIDVLVNNAGVSQPLKTMDISQDDYDRVLDVSLRGTFNMSQAVI
ncbi:MAG: SDR family oxidoreductase, partial [Pseudomonadota bacterium]